MIKNNLINIAVLVLIVLGIVIIYSGLSGHKINWNPIITGIGFFVISWALYLLKK